MSEHIAGPWFVSNGINIWSDAGIVAVAESQQLGELAAADNAAFIVRACNSHADLLEACIAWQQLMNDPPHLRSEERYELAMRLTGDAIDKAGGK